MNHQQYSRAESTQKYSSNQVHALIAKHSLDNNVEALIELGKSYPKFQTPIGDLIVSLRKREAKVNERLKEAGL